jgi:hypothetical protein
MIQMTLTSRFFLIFLISTKRLFDKNVKTFLYIVKLILKVIFKDCLSFVTKSFVALNYHNSSYNKLFEQHKNQKFKK